MEIINETVQRGVRDCNDIFLKFVSKDGMGLSEYPTVIFLANKLFLKSEGRIGAHVNITETIKLKDDFIWFKLKTKEEMKSYISSTLSEKETYTGAQFFTEDTDTTHQGIINYWRTTDIHYIRAGSSLKSSDISPFDENSKTITFPRDIDVDKEIDFTDIADNVVDICSLNSSSDLILTKTRLYRYDYTTNTLTQRFRISNGEFHATAMCRTENYFVIVCNSGGGIFIITNIDSSDSTALEYRKAMHSYTSQTGKDGTTELISNGLNAINTYTFCFPKGEDVIEVNKNGTENCVLDCARWMSSNAYTVPNVKNPGCTKSCHYNNEVILFAQEKTYDASGNVYTLENGNSCFKFDKYAIFIGKGAVLEEGAEEEVEKTTLSVFFNDTAQEEKSITLYPENAIPSDVTTGYVQDKDNVFLFTASGKTYRNIGKDSSDYPAIFPIAFDYDKDRTVEKADVDKIMLTIFTLIDLLSGQMPWEKVNNRDSTFVYMRFSLDTENSRWFSFGDDARRDTTFRDMAAAFDVN